MTCGDPMARRKLPSDDEGYHRDYDDFLARYPAYLGTSVLDALREREYRRLDERGHVYLDYTGGGLYAVSQIEEHMRLLLSGIFGNPHSSSPASAAATDLVESTREHILRYFRASADEYVVVFTQNATAAIKLVAESYPFGPETRLLLTADNHNSVNGIREYASARGAEVSYLPLTQGEERIDAGALSAALPLEGRRGGLFAFPAQSNFTGVQHDLAWIKRAQQEGWDVLLDAAAYAPTNGLDLGAWQPDFVSISFYKMFGYPTGIGCLIARKQALHKLVRPWYAGGTVAFASVQAFRGPRTAHYLLPGSTGFEDGTLNYLSIPAVDIGLRHIEQLGIDTIHARVRSLTGWLLEELCALRYRGGQRLVHVYGPVSTAGRGGTVLFNLLQPDGRVMEPSLVQRQADSVGISLRSGCHCNPGAREAAFGMQAADLEACFAGMADSDVGSFMNSVADKMDGALRASFGIASNFRDAWQLMLFLDRLQDRNSG